MVTAAQLSGQLKVALLALYDGAEAAAIARVAGEETFGKEMMRSNASVPAERLPAWHLLCEKLMQGMPLQYALGRAWFMDLTLRVTPDVLIPRPETEELVDHIIRRTALPAPRILDIGTGSGCIAIALKKNIPGSIVTGCDISYAALAIATQNAAANGTDASFIFTDILDAQVQLPHATYDLIVSNPPYIDPADQRSMHQNVVQFEPHIALFAHADDPFVFYRSIALCATTYLQGALWFEIAADTGDMVADILAAHKFTDIEVIRDMQGKERFVTGRFE